MKKTTCATIKMMKKKTEVSKKKILGTKRQAKKIQDVLTEVRKFRIANEKFLLPDISVNPKETYTILQISNTAELGF